METHLHNTPVYCDKFEAEADLNPRQLLYL